MEASANTHDLSFEDRCSSIRRSLPDDGSTSIHTSLHFNVRRGEILSDSFKSLAYRPDEEIKYGKIEPRFSRENMADGEKGIVSEWFAALTSQICIPDFALFKVTASGHLHPNSFSVFQGGDYLTYFRFFGRMIAKGLFEGWNMDFPLSTAMCRQLLGKPVSFSDLQDVDPDNYRSLMSLLQTKVEGNRDDLKFSVIGHKFCIPLEIDLIENGRNTPVNEENKQLYIEHMARWHMFGCVEEQFDSFLAGFNGIIPAEHVSLFNEQELQQIFSGGSATSVDAHGQQSNQDS